VIVRGDVPQRLAQKQKQDQRQKQGQRQRTGVSAPHKQFSTRIFCPHESIYPRELPLLAAWREVADRERLGGVLEGDLFAVAFDYCHSDYGERSQNKCPSGATFRHVYLTGGLMRARLRLEDVKIIVLSGYNFVVFGECQDTTPLKP